MRRATVEYKVCASSDNSLIKCESQITRSLPEEMLFVGNKEFTGTIPISALLLLMRRNASKYGPTHDFCTATDITNTPQGIVIVQHCDPAGPRLTRSENKLIYFPARTCVQSVQLRSIAEYD